MVNFVNFQSDSYASYEKTSFDFDYAMLQK